MYLVYRHTCLLSGKAYVGWTSFSMLKRWRKHLDNAAFGHDYRFYRAIRKYGSMCWKHEVLGCYEERIDAKHAEKAWVKRLRTFVDGYNMTLGGDGATGAKRSEETKRKMSKAHTGRKHTLASRNKIRKAVMKSLLRPGMFAKLSARSKGKPTWNKGKKLLTGQGNHRTDYRSKCVDQLTLQGEFITTWSSITKAATTLGVFGTSISACCHGRIRTSYGFIWRFSPQPKAAAT